MVKVEAIRHQPCVEMLKVGWLLILPSCYGVALRGAARAHMPVKAISLQPLLYNIFFKNCGV